MDKLILANVKEDCKKRGSTVMLYPDTQRMIQDLCARSGLNPSFVVNKILRFALPYVEIEGESEDKKE